MLGVYTDRAYRIASLGKVSFCVSSNPKLYKQSPEAPAALWNSYRTPSQKPREPFKGTSHPHLGARILDEETMPMPFKNEGAEAPGRISGLGLGV